MSIQLSVSARNGRLDSIEASIGTSAILKIKTGAQPSDCASADTGTVLATLNLPSDYFSAASSGEMEKTGTWEDASADDTGTAAHFRLYASDGTTCHLQGSISVISGGGDMELGDISLTAGQAVLITTFTLTDGNP